MNQTTTAPKKNMRDIFQPRYEPARSIYGAFQSEAAKRGERSLEAWLPAELEAVHREAVFQADKLGLQVPQIRDVSCAERYARKSADYGAKRAYAVVDVMHKAAENENKD